MNLSPDQDAATDLFLDFLTDQDQSEMILKGPAGCGKTFLTRYLVDCAKQHVKTLSALTGIDGSLNVEYTSTTNKASDILSLALGEETKTIYSLLGLRVKDDYKTGKSFLTKTRQYMPQKNTLIIIDEAGMLATQAIKIIRDSATDCKILYILDEYQLNPIFESTCPIIELVENQAKLTTAHRNAGPILALANQFRETVDTNVFKPIVPVPGIIDHLKSADFAAKIAEEFKHTKDDINHAKVVAWTNKVVIGTNLYIRSLFTSSKTYEVGETLIASSPLMAMNGKITVRTEQSIVITDVQEDFLHPVLQIEGVKYGYANGNIFVPEESAGIEYFNTLREDALATRNWRTFMQNKQLIGDVRPPYASTVHKSQGSTYKYVFINLTDIGKNNKANEVARLLYVAISRASHGVIFNGKLPAAYAG